MKKQATLFRSLTTVAIVTIALLLVPFISMQFTSQVNWSAADFLIMGALIFGIGLSYVIINRFAPNWVYRIAITLALMATFLMIWVNMAVGLIGSGPNAANIMYGIIVLVAVVGVTVSRLRAAGMERTMYAMVSMLMLLTGVALLAGMDQYPGSSSKEILAVGAFFSVLFFVSGRLFNAAKNPRFSQNV
ncbi:hypothetical protein [Niabella hibiscisoli]|uniref:hypothetical protein n=1 Tax=Niabella hibiscisoli TaxID=1825928 RepID=UPI001F0D1338|nr:hypothetical protein [Niabella hibiscisoli]MCH5719723.1 hypothetical protein [Niabella hibiscisoli]